MNFNDYIARVKASGEINVIDHSAEEIFIDQVLFMQLCNALMSLLLEQNEAYFKLIKLNKNMESVMIEANFVRFVINDILASEEYTLSGIAFYTRIPEEVVYDLASGINTNPSLSLTRKMVELHRAIKPGLYQNLMRKITNFNPEAA